MSPLALTSSPHFTHLIVESDKDAQFLINNGGWAIVEIVWGFNKWNLPTKEEIMNIGKGIDSLDIYDLVPKMEKEEKLWIMERRGWN